MADDIATPQVTLPDVIVTPEDKQPDTMTPGSPSGNVLDQVTSARQAGYSWPEIDQHVAGIHQRAEQLGYSEDDSNRLLGYQDPKLVGDQLDAMAQSAVANGSPGDHPLTTASHGLLDPANDKTGLVPGGAIPEAIMGTYANALLNGGVKGPSDFAQMFTQSAVDASGDPDNQDMADFGMKGLVGQFPDNKQLTDYALGLAQHMDMDNASPDDIAGIKRNMMDVWTSTGLPLQSIFQQAVADPRAADALARQPLNTFGPLPGDLHLNPELPTKGVTRPFAPGEWLDNPDKSWSNEMSWTVDVRGKPSVVPGLWLVNGVPTHVNEDTAARYAEASGLNFPSFGSQEEAEKAANDREVQWQDKQRGDTSVPGLWTGRIKDPSKIQTVLPQDAIYDPLGDDANDPVGPLGTINQLAQLLGMINYLAYLPGVQYEHSKKVEDMEAATNEDGTPKYTDEQIFAEKMESPTLKILALILVTRGVGAVWGKTYGALTHGSPLSISEGMTRLYRAEAPGVNGRWFADNKTSLNFYLDDQENARSAHYVDVPTSDLDQYRVANHPAHPDLTTPDNPRPFSGNPQHEFYLPQDLADAKQTLPHNTIQEVLKALASDESGELKKMAPALIVGNDLVRQGMSSEEYAAWAASKPREYGKAIMRDLGMGQPDMAHAVAAAAIEPYIKELNKYVPEFQKELAGPRGSNFNPETNTFTPRSTLRNLMDNMEGKANDPGVVPISEGSELHPIVQAIKFLDANMWNDIEARVAAGTIDPVGFIEDHYAHMWERPDEASRIFGAGRGSSRFLRERSIPTMGDGIDAGLTPKILNPIESELLYAKTTGRWLGNADVRADAADLGIIQYGGERKPGWGELDGASAVRNGQRAQAPLAYASAYNDWVGRGVYDWKVRPIGDTGMSINPGTIYDNLQMMANGATGLKLAAGIMYHSQAIIQETLASGAALAWGELTGGTWADFGNGLKTLGFTMTILPQLVRTERIGAALKRQYEGTRDYGPEYEAVKNYLASANMRMGGRNRFGGSTSGLDVTNAGPMSNLFTAFSRGTALMEQSAAIRKVFGLPGESAALSTVLSGPRVLELAFKELGMVNDTLNHLPFDVVIPHLKMGVAGLEVARFLRKNPMATHEETMKATRGIVDSVDNRLGELNQDNLFWARGLKQAFNLYTVSLGWELGTLRAFGGGAAKVVQGAGQLVTGKAPVAWNTTQARWMLGFPAALALTNAVAQYLTSPVPVGQGGFGEAMKDLFIGGRTGGTNPDGSPERRLSPGYEQVFFDGAYDWSHSARLLGPTSDVRNPLQAAGMFLKSKANPGVQIGQSIFTGKEWFNWHDVVSKKPDGVSATDWSNGLLSHFFSSPGQIAPGWLQYLRYIENQTAPIFTQNQPKPGTAIGEVGRFLGDKPVPHYIEQDTDPAPSGGRGRTYNGGGGGSIPSGFGGSSSGGGGRGGGIPSGWGRSSGGGRRQ